jgi:hypothetical protein
MSINTDELTQDEIDALFTASVRDGDAPIVRARRFLTEKARLHRNSTNKALLIQVYTTDVAQAALLKQHFGGNYYPHRTGYQWSTSNRATLRNIYKEIAPQLITVTLRERFAQLIEMFVDDAGASEIVLPEIAV